MPQTAPRKNYRTRGADFRQATIGFGIIERAKRELADVTGLWIRREIFKAAQGDTTSVSVGQRSVPVQQPSYVISEVVDETVGTETVTVHPEIDRRDEVLEETANVTSVTTGVKQTNSWETFQKFKAAGFPAYHIPSGAYYNPETGETIIQNTTPTTQINAPTTTTGTTGGSMDLGSIFTDLATTFIQTKYAPTPTTQVLGPSLPQVGSDIIDYFTDPGTGVVMPVTRKKPCRRRRKRLATKSDLGDLAALKAILGNGEAFKAWIATHSR